MKRSIIAIMTAFGLLSAGLAQGSVIDHPFFRILGVVVVWGTDNAAGTAAITSDFVLMTTGSGNAGADIIAADGRAVITGTLNGAPAAGAEGSLLPIAGATSGGAFTDNGTSGFLDAADVLTAFGLDATTDVGLSGSGIQHSFYVASNTAFDIYAQATNLSATGDFGALTLANIDFAIAVDVTGPAGALTYGANAQDPSTGGTGVDATVDDLSDMVAIQKIFDGGQRTANSVGTIVTQSVGFDATYDLNDGAGGSYDLSMGTGLIEADVTYTIYVP